MELIGPYLVACTLLVVAGGMKAVRPADTARALAPLLRVSVRGARVLVRAGATAEAALGVAALVAPRAMTAAGVAASYAAFAVFVAYAKSKGGVLATCGCFGGLDAPPTVLHVVIDVALGASAVAVVAADPRGTVVSVLAGQPLAGVPLLAGCALCAWLAFLGMSAAGRLHAARLLVGAPARRSR